MQKGSIVSKLLKNMVGPWGLEPQTSTVSTTYKTAGTAKTRGSRAKHHSLWVGLWVGSNSNSDLGSWLALATLTSIRTRGSGASMVWKT